MALISEGISKVRAFVLPCGIWENGVAFDNPKAALVKWNSLWQDKFYQAYVNGRYAGSTFDVHQRHLVVHLPKSLKAPVKIEIFEVEPEESFIDFSNELDFSPAQSGRVKITLLRTQSLPLAAVADVYFDNGTGEIDYENPINDFPVKIWPSSGDKAGFGMSRFGMSDFGYDSSAAIGFGRGSFGYGQFGLDADPIEWISKPLPAGVYKFAVKVTDRFGNQSVSAQTRQVAVTPAAAPAEGLEVLSFDKQTNQLVLNIT